MRTEERSVLKAEVRMQNVEARIRSSIEAIGYRESKTCSKALARDVEADRCPELIDLQQFYLFNLLLVLEDICARPLVFALGAGPMNPEDRELLRRHNGDSEEFNQWQGRRGRLHHLGLGRPQRKRVPE